MPNYNEGPTDFERGRHRGITQAAVLVRNHFDNNSAMRGLFNEIASLAYFTTPDGQDDKTAHEHDQSL